MNVRALRRGLPAIRLPFRGQAVQRLAAALLAYEPYYVIPVILLLLLAIDGTLIDAWNLERFTWLGALDVARRPALIGVLIALPLLAWAARAALTGSFAAAPSPEIGLLFLMGGAQFGYTQSVAPDGSRVRLLGVIGAIYLYYLVVNTTPDLRALRRWLAGLVVAAAVGALLTLSLLGFQLDPSASAALLGPLLVALQPFALGPTFHLAFFEISQRTVANPNGLADFALVVALCAGAGALFGRSPAARVGWLAVAAGAALLLLASGARTAVLGAAAGAALLLLASRRRWLAAAIPVALLLLLFVAIPASKIGELLDLRNSEALLARLQVWSAYWGIVREHPITGAGLGLRSVAESYAARYGLSLYFTDPHAHSVLLQTYLEQTILGLAGLLIVLYAAARATIRLPRLLPLPHQIHDAAAIALAAAAAAAALVAHNLFDGNLNTNFTAALFLGLIALTIRGAQLAASGAEAEPPRVTLSASGAFTALAGILLLVTLLGLLPPPLAPHLYIR